jgi:glycosyltransferase involved in cell wall biosynthesis
MSTETGNQPQIEVLLATYNGAAYLRDQIDSVLAQTSVDLRILARDDGSRDETPAILAGYAETDPSRFRIIETGTPTGAAHRNFARLLQASTAPYAAFCDQDDIWLPGKLQLELTRMQQIEQQHRTATPILIYTDLQVVDASLTVQAKSLWQQNGLANAQHPPLAQLLADNTVTGCTALINRALANRISDMPPTTLMHDHWAALIAAGTGIIEGIPEATVLYRQHSNNVVGAVASKSPLEKVKRLIGKDAAADRALQYGKDRAQAQSLLNLHGSSMSAEARTTVEAFVGLADQARFARLRTMQRHNLWRSGTARKLTAIADILRG